MAVAVVQEWPNAERTTQGYDAVSGEIRQRTGGAPDGLLFQCAGFDGDTFRVFSAWESPGHFKRFFDDVLMPVVHAAAAGGTEPETRQYELHAVTVPPRGAEV